MTQPSSTHVFTLDAGSHWICTCGQSKNSPHCDGSHKGSPFSPLTLELETTKQIEIPR